MRIEFWSYDRLMPDGTFENDPKNLKGSVHPEPRLDTNGNHHLSTYSAKQSGNWISVSTGRLQDKQMHGITITFDNEQERRDFEHKRIAICDWKNRN